MAVVFISHSSEDAQIAQSIYKELCGRGINCWIAPNNISPGEDWANAINNAINSSPIFLLVYSQHAAESPQVPRELTLAAGRGATIIPYVIEDCPLVGAFEYYLSSCHWIKADVANNDLKIDDIAGSIYGVLYQMQSRTPTPAPAAPAQPAPKRSGGVNWGVLSIILITIAVIAAVVIAAIVGPGNNGGGSGTGSSQHDDDETEEEESSSGNVSKYDVDEANQYAAYIRDTTTSFLTKMDTCAMRMTDKGDFTLEISIDEDGVWSVKGGSGSDWIDNVDHWGTDSVTDSDEDLYYIAYLKYMIIDLTNCYVQVNLSNGRCIGVVVVTGTDSDPGIALPTAEEYKSGNTSAAFEIRDGISGGYAVGTSPVLIAAE